MNKKLLVAAIATAIATPMVANADAIMYGKVRVATQYASRSNDAQDSWGLQDQVSRLGVKGSEDLDNGLKAIYKMEFGINVGNGFGQKDASNGNFISQRNSYVGLSGAFGTVLAGRHDTPFKMSTDKFDYFKDTNADMDSDFGSPDAATGVGLFDSLRVNGAIAYVSPDFAGFTLAAAAVQGGTMGLYDKSDKFAGAYSVAGMYQNGPWLASLAYETLDPEVLAGAKNADSYDKWRVGVGMDKFNNISASFIYEEGTNTNFIDGADTHAWQIQAAYDLPMPLRLMGMYGEFNGDKTLPDFKTWALGVQHDMSKRTNVQLIYRQKDIKHNTTALPDDDVFALQMNHEF